MHNFSLQNHGAVSHMTVMTFLQKYGFRLNQSSDGEDVTKLSIAKDGWGQLKESVSCQEYV